MLFCQATARRKPAKILGEHVGRLTSFEQLQVNGRCRGNANIIICLKGITATTSISCPPPPSLPTISIDHDHRFTFEITTNANATIYKVTMSNPLMVPGEAFAGMVFLGGTSLGEQYQDVNTTACHTAAVISVDVLANCKSYTNERH